MFDHGIKSEVSPIDWMGKYQIINHRSGFYEEYRVNFNPVVAVTVTNKRLNQGYTCIAYRSSHKNRCEAHEIVQLLTEDFD